MRGTPWHLHRELEQIHEAGRATGCPTPGEEHFVTPGVAPDSYLGTRKIVAQLELSLSTLGRW
jgi:hypothetical protein